MRISDWSSDVCSSDLPVLHRVRHQLRPAFAPQIVGHLGAVAIGHQPADLARPVGAAPMHLADAEDRVRSTTLLHAAMHVRRLVQFRSDEHTSELQSLMRISYAVHGLENNTELYVTKQ